MLQHEARRLFDFSGRPLARVLRMVGILRRGSSDWSFAGGFSDHDVFTIVAMLTHIGYFVEDLGPND
jgi:hypothetical protein